MDATILLSAISRLSNWLLPPTGSKLKTGQVTLTDTTYTTLLDTYSGHGKLVAIGWRRSAIGSQGGASSYLYLDKIETTIDGGAAKEVSGLGDSTGACRPTLPITNSAMEHAQWIPCDLPFASSIKIRVQATGIANSLYVYYMIEEAV